MPIASGGVVVAELKQGRFFAIDAPPGRYSIGTEAGVPAFIDVHAGEEVFVRLNWRHQVGLPPIPVMKAVGPEQARKEMMHLSYIDAGRAHSSSVPKADPREPDELRLKRRPGR